MAPVELTLDLILERFGDTIAASIVAVKHIGKGGFGSVAELTTVDGRTFVGKLIGASPHALGEPISCTESSLLLDCGDSVWFVKVFESCLSTDQKLWLILMEPCVRSLAQHLRLEKMIDERDLKPLAAQLILAVNHMHSLKIIHHDIKPSNLLLGHDGLWKLADFGNARRFIGECIDSEVSSVKAGTSRYVAPEVIEGKSHGSRADTWSLGVVLYELATGRPPFASDEEACNKDEDVTFSLGFPRDLRRLLGRMLCKDPMQRMPIEEVIASEYFAKALESLKAVASNQASPISQIARANILSEIDAVSSALRTCSGRILYKGWVNKPNGDPRYMVLTERLLGTSLERLYPTRGDHLGYSNAQPVTSIRSVDATGNTFAVALNVSNGGSAQRSFTSTQATYWAAAINSAIEKQITKTEKSMTK